MGSFLDSVQFYWKNGNINIRGIQSKNITYLSTFQVFNLAMFCCFQCRSLIHTSLNFILDRWFVWCYCKWYIFLKLFFIYLLLISRNSINFCIWTLYFTILLNSLIRCGSYSIEAHKVFYIYNQVVCKYWQFQFSCPTPLAFLSFSFFGASILSKTCKSWHLCLFSDLVRNSLIFHY